MRWPERAVRRSVAWPPHTSISVTRRSFLAALAISAAAPRLALGATPRWTDGHVHIIGGPMRAFASATQQAASQIDALQMGRMIVMPPPQPNALFEFSDFVSELTKYPSKFGFLGGGGSLNPMIHSGVNPTPETTRQFADQAKRIAEAGASGFGEIALLHMSMTANHPFEQVSPEHPLMMLLAEIAGARGLIIDLHMDCIVGDGEVPTPPGFHIPPNPPKLIANVAAFERLLAHERRARFIWAHGGSDYTGNQTPALIKQLMDRHANLFMSLRVVPGGAGGELGVAIQNKILTDDGINASWLALLRAHPDRFVLGSDSFFVPAQIPPQAPGAAFARGNQAKLTAATLFLNRLPADVGMAIAMSNPRALYKATL